MAQVNQPQFSGEYMVQDSDHLSDSSRAVNKAKGGNVRQADQSQSGSRQQGGDQASSRQHGGQRRQAQ